MIKFSFRYNPFYYKDISKASIIKKVYKIGGLFNMVDDFEKVVTIVYTIKLSKVNLLKR